MFCRVCGEEKEAREFYRLKHFYKYLNARKIWCRDCMKMFVEMKKEETRKKDLDQKEWLFVLRFD
jgi:hypothetical protein